MAKVTTTATTTTLKQIAAEIAEDHELHKKQIENVLASFVSEITKTLKKGNRVRVPGLGIFKVNDRKARMGRNPATGETIKIKASKKAVMTVAKDLKEAVL